MSPNIAITIIRDGKVPADWEQSFIVCLYKGKGDVLDQDNYRGLKLTERAMKVIERIADSLIMTERRIPLKQVLGALILMNRLNKTESAVFLYCLVLSISEGSFFQIICTIHQAQTRKRVIQRLYSPGPLPAILGKAPWLELGKNMLHFAMILGIF